MVDLPAGAVRRAVPAGRNRFIEGWAADGDVILEDTDGDLWTLTRTPHRWRIVDADGVRRITRSLARAVELAEAAGARFHPWQPAP